MKNMIDKYVYAEVYEILKRRNDKVEKIPKKIIEHIRKNGEKINLNKTYNEDVDILQQVSRGAQNLWLSIFIKYIANDNQKENLKEILIRNEIKYKNLE